MFRSGTDLFREINQLAEYDGTHLTLVPNPGKGSITGSMIAYNNKLYFQYYSHEGQQLAQYDGGSVKLIPNPQFAEPGFDSHELSYSGDPIIFNNRLYLNYSGYLGYLEDVVTQ